MTRDEIETEYRRLTKKAARLRWPGTLPHRWSDRIMERRRAEANGLEDEAPHLLRKHKLEYIEEDCEVCGKMLFEGDMGFRYEDGPALCADHAPTFADCLRELLDAGFGEGTDLDYEDAEDQRIFFKRQNRRGSRLRKIHMVALAMPVLPLVPKPANREVIR